MSTNPSQARPTNMEMYGVPDIEVFAKDVEASITFEVSGGAMCVMSLMSDAQELIAAGQGEAARQTLNRAKFLLARFIMGGQAG